MTRATRCAEYTGATTLCLYLAFELGSNEWKLGFTTEPGATPRVRRMPARDLERLTREIADARQWFGLKATTPVGSCYEAGRDGFWLHRYLTASGIANVVVDHVIPLPLVAYHPKTGLDSRGPHRRCPCG